MSLPFNIRNAIDNDLNFILSTFNKSVKKHSVIGKSTQRETFFAEFPQIADKILAESEVSVACSLEDSDQILGYIIHQPTIIHYIYIKELYQGEGIAKALVEHTFPEHDSIEYSINTEAIKKISKKYTHLIHNPFHLYEGRNYERR